MKNVGSHSMIVAIVTVVLVAYVPAAPLQAQERNCEYFIETGHAVCDEFLEFFETRGALEIFGYPLTEAFDDSERGLRVQYFQRARMEWHPYNPEPYKVLLGLLIDELGYQFSPLPPEEIPPFNNNLHHYFPQTGHVVSHAFLQYFREHGGVDVFGYPRSEPMYVDGYLVQYFQRARMEWHPENPSGLQMRLTYLGETCIERFDVPEQYVAPRNPSDEIGINALTVTADRVARLQVSASVRHIVTGQEGSQTVFVYVTDQWQKPVSEANVAITVRYQPETASYECAPTDDKGFAEYQFDILPAPPGQNVVVDVVATHGSLTSKTQTFFLPWW